MASSIPAEHEINFMDYLTSNINTSFSFESINESKVRDIIKQLNSKSSSGNDGISTNILKKLEPLLSKSLALIINQSLNTGIFPERLKLAKITPVHKKDDVYSLGNYRPISILPSISKVFEKAVFDQLYSYFSQNAYFCKNQYGFRKQHSTEHAILELVDRITLELDNGNTPMAIYLDLSKAFDTLDHNILLAKLRYYGVGQLTLDWFKSYLLNRPHYVQIDQCKSNCTVQSIGVPQGSILGPLLFTIYTNDIQNSTPFFNFIKYADDTTLLNSMKGYYQDISTTVNVELNKVYRWLCINKLSLNIKKTKYMLFHNKTKKRYLSCPSIKLKDVQLERVENFNFLGIIMNENLSWNSHIDLLCSKISRSIGILCRLKKCMPNYILKIIYSTLILSHCTYGILAWGSNTSRIFKLQKKAIRIVSNANYISHTEPLFKTLGLLKICDIYKLQVLQSYYQYSHNQLPFYLQHLEYRQRVDIHEYDTRNKSMLNINKTNTKLADNSLRNITPNIVNNTPDIIISKIFTHSLHGFTSYIKQYFISLYKMECIIDDCYVCKTT